jgi:hypothetical protein
MPAGMEHDRRRVASEALCQDFAQCAMCRPVATPIIFKYEAGGASSLVTAQPHLVVLEWVGQQVYRP